MFERMLLAIAFMSILLLWRVRSRHLLSIFRVPGRGIGPIVDIMPIDESWQVYREYIDGQNDEIIRSFGLPPHVLFNPYVRYGVSHDAFILDAEAVKTIQAGIGGPKSAEDYHHKQIERKP